jgi:hypothetical protein
MTGSQARVLLVCVCMWVGGGGGVTKAGLAVDPVPPVPRFVWAFYAYRDLQQPQQQQPA